MPPAGSIALQGGGLSQVGGASGLSKREGETCVLGGCGGTGGHTRLALGLISQYIPVGGPRSPPGLAQLTARRDREEETRLPRKALNFRG